MLCKVFQEWNVPTLTRGITNISSSSCDQPNTNIQSTASYDCSLRCCHLGLGLDVEYHVCDSAMHLHHHSVVTTNYSEISHQLLPDMGLPYLVLDGIICINPVQHSLAMYA